MTATERILPRLSAVRPRGENRWTARCPAHEDRSPSLAIRQTHDRTLIKCWAGCKASDVLAAIGLKLGDLFDDHRYHDRPDALAQRKRRAAETRECWRQAKIRRL